MSVWSRIMSDVVHDHIVIAKSGHSSFKTLGLL